MSFRIHAAGPGTPYIRRNCADGDIFQAAAVMSAFRASSPSARGAGEGVADYVLPSPESAMREGVRAIARMTFFSLMRDQVTLLAMHPRAHGGWISVYANKSNLIMPDTNSIARYNFFPGVSPGAEFFTRIAPTLTATDMNNYGVLLQIAMALSHFHGRTRRNVSPMISIQLHK